MNALKLFISRPIGVTLITLAIAFLGFFAYFLLPVSPLPQVDFPTIMVRASQPGASPETMATTIATPLERSLGRIAGITEMTSHSSLGSTRIIIQFDLDRDIDGAARDVQAAINAARATLPTLPSNPTYFKLNPADMPIMILSLCSDDLPVDELFDVASTVLGQKIAQAYGVGRVFVGGGSLPAVRVELNPGLLNSQGISLNEVRGVLSSANANLPKGVLDNGHTQWFVGANDQLMEADEFSPLIIRYQDGAHLRLAELGEVVDSVEDVRNAGYANGRRSVLLIVFRQPGANIIETVKNVRASLPLLREWMPENAELEVLIDRSPSIANSVKDVEKSLIISMLLVVLVVWLFLRNGRATFIPAVAVPVSLLGTFAIMYLAGFSLNHLSLMALTIATGFVVDDAIVVTENIVRHMENGADPLPAAEKGSREVCFTVISISLSLVAIFIPILGMGGIVGRLFKEFAVTLSAAVMVSLGISLFTTPMMCGHILRPGLGSDDESHRLKETKRQSKFFMGGIFGALLRFGNRIMRGWSNFLDKMHETYAILLSIVLKHRFLTLLSLILTIALNIYLYISIPKGFIPDQDTGQIRGSIIADQSISFEAMQPKFMEFMKVIESHPDVVALGGYTGGGQRNTGSAFITLRSLKERTKSTRQIMEEITESLEHIPGARLYMSAMQDIRAGGRESRAEHQFTLQSDNLRLLREWTPKIEEALREIPEIIDLSSDQDTRGLQTTISADREAMARYGLTYQQIDTALGLAFGQSFVSTIFAGSNQYRVVMEYETDYLRGPDSLVHVYIPALSDNKGSNLHSSFGSGIGSSGNISSSFASADEGAKLVPLNAVASASPTLTALGVSHQEQFSASTLSFNLKEGTALSDVQIKIEECLAELNLPSGIIAGFQGTSKQFTQMASQQPLLILAAILTLYIVLGVLYESLIHPLTILSTLPSAGIGALLGLMLFDTQFTLIAFIGVLLLAGIVKKNAIMMVDFAIIARREEGLSAEEAIYKACLLRFRPIMMTTMAAIFGALPLLFSFGEGADLRTPLGITIVGGLIMSQILTLFTTPVVYLYLDRFATAPEKRAIARLQKESTA